MATAKSLFEAFQPTNETPTRPPYRIPHAFRKIAADAILEALATNAELTFFAVFYSGHVLTDDETRKVANFILSLLEPGCSTSTPNR